MAILEKDIESVCCKLAKAAGWLSYKFVSVNNRGVPDRLFIKDGATVYVEFKAPNKLPTALQLKVHEEIRAHGAEVHVVDDIQAFQRIFKC